MSEEVYDRPREKLRDRGVRSLTLAELLQVILGSGSRGIPVARLAREAAKVITSAGEGHMHERLTLIKGMGAAKAAQITASIELARHLTWDAVEGKPDQVRRWLLMPSPIKRLTVRYCLLFGDGSVASEEEYIPKGSEHYLYAVRQVMKRTLATGAESISIAINMADGARSPALFESGFYRALYQQATAAQMRVAAAYIVSDGSVRLVSRKGVSRNNG